MSTTASYPTIRTDIGGVPVSGMEAYLDKRLTDPRFHGAPVALSIDSRVQAAMESALATQVTKHFAVGGAGLVLDVHTGEILAMASLPVFNPNAPGLVPVGTDPLRPDARYNRTISSVYEFGSTFKMITVANAITGTGTITQSGSGTTTLTGTDSAGGTFATSGRLDVSGSLTSNATVSGPAFLGGTGTITGNVSGSGTIAPGTSAGVLTVGGNLTPTGTVQFEVNAPYTTAGTDYDQLAVNPPGTTIASTSRSCSAAPSSLAHRSASTQRSVTAALWWKPPARSASVTER